MAHAIVVQPVKEKFESEAIAGGRSFRGMIPPPRVPRIRVAIGAINANLARDLQSPASVAMNVVRATEPARVAAISEMIAIGKMPNRAAAMR